MQTISPDPKVIFFQVRDNRTKMARIVETAQAHFERKERLIFLVDDLKAQTFLDELLWKMPSESFLPHSLAEAPMDDWIVISKVKQNLNQAKAAFNLCSTPLLIDGSFRVIYDFEDLTAPNKQTLSNVRYDAYKGNHWVIEAKP